MTAAIEPTAAALAADQAAIPILVFSDEARCVWANTQAEEWLGLSIRNIRKSRFGELSAVCAHLADIVDQACDARRTLVALGRPLGGAGLYDVHARWSDQHEQLALSVLPHQSMGAKASEAPALGFGRMLAHELKNPLASVRGAAPLIRRETELEGARDLARLIIQDVDRITRLADHWSRVGDIRLGEQSEINLNLLAVSAMESLNRADPATIGVLRENFDPSLPSINGDPDLLMQAVLNLIQNAFDAVRSDPGGTITVETRYDAGPRSRSSGHPTPLVLSVRDNGPGIPESLGPGIFTPFVTTKPAGEGLGLAFAARIAALHDGQIDFESRPGTTVFNIRLPIAKKDLP